MHACITNPKCRRQPALLEVQKNTSLPAITFCARGCETFCTQCAPCRSETQEGRCPSTSYPETTNLWQPLTSLEDRHVCQGLYMQLTPRRKSCQRQRRHPPNFERDLASTTCLCHSELGIITQIWMKLSAGQVYCLPSALPRI